MPTGWPIAVRKMAIIFVVAALASGPVAFARAGHSASRSAAAKNAFKKRDSCPANGKSSGSCLGYVIDHIKPFACGGADAPANMP